jgi:hypothetical protein
MMLIMPKTQKSLQFNDEVFEWFDAMESKTGASHSRIALAAIITYMMADAPTQGYYMNAAVQVDKGALSFKDLPEVFAAHMVANFESLLNALRERHHDDMLPEVERLLAEARAQLDTARGRG